MDLNSRFDDPVSSDGGTNCEKQDTTLDTTETESGHCLVVNCPSERYLEKKSVKQYFDWMEQQ